MKIKKRRNLVAPFFIIGQVLRVRFTNKLQLSVAAIALILAIVVAPKETTVKNQSCELDEDCAVTSACALVGESRVCVPRLSQPPRLSVIEALSLGRREAAADLIWLQVVQFVGNSTAQVSNFKGLAPWLELVTRLDANFTLAYVYAGALLPTSRASADEAEVILARGEATQGQDSQLAMWRGFVAYYGQMKPLVAADHFERSAKLGGPKYLLRRAQTLRKESKDCKSLEQSLKGLRRDLSSSTGADVLNDEQAQKILIGCVGGQIKNNMAVFRINNGRAPKSVEELLDEGLLESTPIAPRGQCWFLKSHDAYLAPCHPAKEGP